MKKVYFFKKSNSLEEKWPKAFYSEKIRMPIKISKDIKAH